MMKFKKMHGNGNDFMESSLADSGGNCINVGGIGFVDGLGLILM